MILKTTYYVTFQRNSFSLRKLLKDVLKTH